MPLVVDTEVAVEVELELVEYTRAKDAWQMSGEERMAAQAKFKASLVARLSVGIKALGQRKS